MARRTLMAWTVATSLRFRYLVAAGGVLLMGLGVVLLPQSRLDVFPEFAPPRVIVQTGALGLATTDVEELITVPLEQALNGVEGLDVLRSKSVPQLSNIELVFESDVDLMEARQLVQERIAGVSATLPSWAAPPEILAPASATARAVKIGITSTDHSLIQVSVSAYYVIRARLMAVPGVANVMLWGQRKDQLQVQVDPAAMAELDVTLEQVMRTTSESVDSGLLRFHPGSIIGTGGVIETPNQRLDVRNVLTVFTPADLAEVPVQTTDGRTVRIGDVATVVQGHQPLIGEAVVNGGPGMLLVVEKLPWADTVELTRGIEEVVRALEPGLPGVQIDTTIFQQAGFIETAIDNLTEAMLLGFLLVAVILALFLFEWRVALISLLTIPLSLVAALLVLYSRDQTINTMTLAGLVIALGAVVDDAIIDVENIVRRLRLNRLSGSPSSTASVILRASLEVRSPIVFATLIIVAAAIPVFLLEGLTGAFFRPLALSYTLAIVASLVVALTVTPALALILLRNAPVERRESPLVRVLQHRYTRVLERTIHRPRRLYAGALAVVLLGLLVTPTLGQALLPHFKERDFLMHWVAQPGTSVTEMYRISLAASEELRQIPGVRNFGAHIGQAVAGDEVYGVNFGENWVSIDPSVDYDETIAAIDAVIADYPGLFRDRKTYLDERVKEVVAGGSEPIVVRLFGPDLDVLRGQAAEIEDVLTGVEGTANAHVDISSDIPQVEVQVDLAAAARYGLKPGDVRRAAAALVAGEEVGDNWQEGRAYDAVVVGLPEVRSSVPAIQGLLIDTPSGQRVRLGDVAGVTLQPSPNAIEREDGSRHLDILADVSGRDLGSVGEDVAAALADRGLPRGYHAELLGEYQEQEAAQARLLATAGIALALVVLLLHASLGGWRPTLLVLLTLPMALIGGVLAAFATGGVLSIGSLVGFFTVFGIAARNGILLINHAQHLEREEGETFGLALVLRAARERLSPILMTSLATGLALVPLVVLGDRPGHEIEHPLAVVILGGLFTSTLLNLFVTPALYLRLGRPRTDERNRHLLGRGTAPAG
ncbi:CzcA family heavy metal efflux pump [Geodermatophilus bullaregiensis]|uniref:efflux RND transporter permease subunit n=1 Tax=Geodermatophilus bullaregiensis TaxID=1564160 RepID=UPI00195E3798|nr:efflux RND transporter permease subunit [Geodermatophilus bullaregiensis]MBM7808608.1 CzcA family heavy metal efflux pump [Geodermatophilus bullaregiensis]